MNILQVFSDNLQSFLLGLGFMGTILSCGLILVESIVPVLPLAIFIAIVFYTFGNLLGLIICWVFTITGCIISYNLCNGKLRRFVENKMIKKLKPKTQVSIEYWMDKIKNMSLASLAVLMAIPFTPAFIVNIAAGLANVSKKKFYIALLIGKAFMVYFWGYIGKSLIESLTDPYTLIKVVIITLIAFVVAKLSNKLLNVE
ncbi:MAG: TVP38/TMEM64 family protein [Bacilli bacterium]|nr:TVP38/TMEM64 family protein [Bacilli bacterium]